MLFLCKLTFSRKGGQKEKKENFCNEKTEKFSKDQLFKLNHEKKRDFKRLK